MIRLTWGNPLVVVTWIWVLVLLASGFPRAGQGSILEEMTGELRLRAPVCGAPFLAFEAAPFGSFHLVPEGAGGGGPGTVSFTVPGGTLTATKVANNGVRGVDPLTGRPIEEGAPPGASCTTGLEPDCWVPGEPTAINANAFDAMCALTKGYTPLDPEACALTIYNSQNQVPGATGLEPRVMLGLTNILSGQCNGVGGSLLAGCSVFDWLAGFSGAAYTELRAFDWVLRTNLTGPSPDIPTPLVPLSKDPTDGPPVLPSEVPPEPGFGFWLATGVQPVLTGEQEALLGCGPFYGTRCDVDGLGLMRYEVSAVGQSWPRFDLPSGTGSWDTTDDSKIQPGTVGFEGQPVCTRYENGQTHILPGCLGPGDPGYDPNVDGSTTANDVFGNATLQYASTVPAAEQYEVDGSRRHPFTGQYFASEMAVLSWNFLTMQVAFSIAGDPNNILPSEFDPDDPFRMDGCSFANPLGCCSVADAVSYGTQAPEEDPSQPPLARWLWEAGAEYLVTEATGDLADFLDWTLFAFGPEQSRVSGLEVGVAFLLSPPDPLPPIPDSPLIVRWGGVDGIVGTADDNFAGVVYGPEPGAALLQLSAVGVVVLLAAFRRRA